MSNDSGTVSAVAFKGRGAAREDWPHQIEAADAIIRALGSGAPRLPGPAVVIATGGGKTGVLGLVKRRLLAPGRQMLTIVHRTEIVDQLVAEYRRAMPGVGVGVVRGAENDAGAPIVVGSVQTLASEHRRRMLRDVGLIAVDECHHATAPSYRAVLGHWPEAGVIGATATMTRADEGSLGAIWRVVYTKGIAALIAEGRLVRPRGLRVRVADLDLAGLRARGRAGTGDITEGDVGRALVASDAPEAIARALVEHAAERKTIVFAPTVEAAHVIAAAVVNAGLSVGVVHGAMPAEDRKSILDRYRGLGGVGLQVLVNCMVLTEGTDLPDTSCIVVARPTQSVGLYVQMVGRGLRLGTGDDALPMHLRWKTDCLVIDIVGVTKRFGLATPIQLFGDEPERAKDLADLDEENEHELDELLAGEDEAVGRELELLGEEQRGPLGALEFREVDLFQASAYEWHSTRSGVPFLDADTRLLCVVPSILPGTYDVLIAHKTRVGVSEFLSPRGMRSQAQAMTLAEAQLTVDEIRRVKYGKSRGARKAASASQTRLLEQLRVPWTQGITAGEASALLSVFFATKRIDGRLPDYMRAGLQR